MADVDLDRDGLAELFGPIGPVARDLYKRGARVNRRVLTLVPRDTGDLARSIEATGGTGPDGLYVDIGSDLEYALPVEMGHEIHNASGGPYGFQPAQPYLRPALNAARDGGR